jgi:hypothetical protein
MLDSVGLGSVPVVAGGEAPPLRTVREKHPWEVQYGERVATVTREMQIETRFSDELAQCDACDTGAAASAIIEAARAAGGGVTILALGAMTNIAEALQHHPTDFEKLISRVVFIGDTDSSRQSYNAALDPAGLRTVLRSGTELVLVGSSCYARPEWVQALFGRGDSTSIDDTAAGAHGGADAQSADSEDSSSSAVAAAVALRTLGSLDPYSMCYDPLALLFHLQPDAFESVVEPAGASVTGDTSTAHGWRFERCAGGAQVEADGLVVEPSEVSLERYASFLRRAARLVRRCEDSEDQCASE